MLSLRSQKLDAALAASEEGDANAENAMESALAEVEDLISYCNDILCTGAAWLWSSMEYESQDMKGHTMSSAF